MSIPFDTWHIFYIKQSRFIVRKQMYKADIQLIDTFSVCIHSLFRSLHRESWHLVSSFGGGGGFFIRTGERRQKNARYIDKSIMSFKRFGLSQSVNNEFLDDWTVYSLVWIIITTTTEIYDYGTIWKCSWKFYLTQKCGSQIASSFNGIRCHNTWIFRV